ncbi:hypothetical protein A0H81_04862 [Grifola frondosa]|uniref:DUF6699 domain-containing protein n=1 Tax=Grifola frondosa TaxID=5627 RepID=A0A1C7MF53_GRIFR|nr:hypothetical protein A0H81_04862 [Grifola frondosa]
MSKGSVSCGNVNSAFSSDSHDQAPPMSRALCSIPGANSFLCRIALRSVSQSPRIVPGHTRLTSIATMAADTVGSKWAAGNSYGPVLSQTDLYLLGTELELNPILSSSNDAFQLIFNIATGQTVGFNHESRGTDVPFTAKDEPATLPRVEELIIITEQSPWCTIVKNPSGVTLNDVCGTLWREYTDKMVTDKEFDALPPRLQEQVRRQASSQQGGGGWQAYYSPASIPTQFKRVDWLRDKTYFDKMHRKDHYSKASALKKLPPPAHCTSSFHALRPQGIAHCSELACTAFVLFSSAAIESTNGRHNRTVDAGDSPISFPNGGVHPLSPPVIPSSHSSPNNPPMTPAWAQQPGQFPGSSPYLQPHGMQYVSMAAPGSYFIPPVALPAGQNTPAAPPNAGLSSDWTGFPQYASSGGGMPHAPSAASHPQTPYVPVGAQTMYAGYQPLPAGFGGLPPGFGGQPAGFGGQPMWGGMPMAMAGAPYATPFIMHPAMPGPMPGAFPMTPANAGGGLPHGAAPPMNRSHSTPAERRPYKENSNWDKIDKFAEGPIMALF